jgi:outer membrane protein assembly factor BamB
VTTVLNGKVYCGGVTGDDGDYTIYCYDPSRGKWTTLPPLPVKYFGLGQVDGKLVAVGGVKKIEEEETNKVHTYDERSRKWKQTIPPMPTARDSPGVLSLQSALVVANGNTPSPVAFPGFE